MKARNQCTCLFISWQSLQSYSKNDILSCTCVVRMHNSFLCYWPLLMHRGRLEDIVHNWDNEVRWCVIFSTSVSFLGVWLQSHYLVTWSFYSFRKRLKVGCVVGRSSSRIIIIWNILNKSFIKINEESDLSLEILTSYNKSPSNHSRLS